MIIINRMDNLKRLERRIPEYIYALLVIELAMKKTNYEASNLKLISNDWFVSALGFSPNKLSIILWSRTFNTLALLTNNRRRNELLSKCVTVAIHSCRHFRWCIVISIHFLQLIVTEINSYVSYLINGFILM